MLSKSDHEKLTMKSVTQVVNIGSVHNLALLKNLVIGFKIQKIRRTFIEDLKTSEFGN